MKKTGSSLSPSLFLDMFHAVLYTTPAEHERGMAFRSVNVDIRVTVAISSRTEPGAHMATAA
jgi:hypothetical protein